MSARKQIVIWLDDERDPESKYYREIINAYAGDPDEVIWIKHPEKFKEAFEEIQKDDRSRLAGIFFDNHLNHGIEGRHLFKWVAKQVVERNLEPMVLHAQTGDLNAKREMRSGFRELRQFWRKNGWNLN